MIEPIGAFSFGDLASRRTSTWSPGDEESDYVGLEHIPPYELRLAGRGSSDEVTSGKTKFHHGDVLFGKLRPYFRKIVRPDFAGICSTEIWALYSKDEMLLDPGYLHWIVANQEFSDFANSAETGTRMPRASWDWVSTYEVALPPLDEQRRIAEVLGTIDSRIQSARRLVGLFSGAAQALSATSPSTCSVSDVASIERIQWSPQRHQGDIVDHYSLPAFDAGAGPERVEASSIASNKFLVREPRVLFSRLNPDTDRTWLCAPADDVSASVCSTEYAVLIPGDVTVGQLWAALSSGEVGGVLAAATTGTSASHQRVREDSVLAATIADPRALSAQEQAAIDIYADALLEQAREAKALRRARDFLLPRLIAGDLRVEAAEELVEADT